MLSFSAAEMSDNGEKLKRDLLGMLPVSEGIDVKINMGDAADISMGALAVILSFVKRIKEGNARAILILTPGLQNYFQTLRIEDLFDEIQQGGGA